MKGGAMRAILNGAPELFAGLGSARLPNLLMLEMLRPCRTVGLLQVHSFSHRGNVIFKFQSSL